MFHWNQGHRVPAQAPVAPASPGIKLPDVIDEKGEETDADIAKKDLILVCCYILVWCCYYPEGMKPLSKSDHCSSTVKLV